MIEMMNKFHGIVMEDHWETVYYKLQRKKTVCVMGIAIVDNEKQTFVKTLQNSAGRCAIVNWLMREVNDIGIHH